MIKVLVFEKNAHFPPENWQKSQKNCDHNIDPRFNVFKSGEIKPFFVREVQSYHVAGCYHS
jgi:hypothetical protein